MPVRSLLAAVLALLSSHALTAVGQTFPPGSAIGLVPPPGMATAKSFSGFQDEAQGASIVLLSFPAVAYGEIAAGFSDDAKLAAQNITAEQRESLTVAGHPALLISGRQRVPGGSLRKWIIVVGHPDAAALVTAQYGDAAAYPDAVIREALLSVAFRAPPTPAEQAAALPFTAPAAGVAGRYRIVSVIGGNTLLLTQGPKDVDPEHEQPNFIASYVAGRQPPPAEREGFVRKQFLGLRAMQPAAIDSVKPATIHGLDAYELIGSAETRGGVPLKLAQWVVFAPGATLVLLGTARATAFEQAYPEFVTLRDDTRPK